MVMPPLLHALEMDRLAAALVSGYSPLCHQEPERSFHFAGHPLLACSRCVALFLGGLTGLLLAPLLRAIAKIEYLPKPLALAGLAPLAADAVLDALGLWTSTMLSRTLTGLTAGAVMALFLLPGIISAVLEWRARFRQTTEVET
jgi:uncharacterized membrane protein